MLIEKLSLSLTMAGSLTALMQLPSLVNPVIGYLGDKVSLRYFVILAPAITATLLNLVGLAPNEYALAILLFISGFSIAAYHALAPAMIGRVAGRQIGKGMSWFMAAGELSRTIGPLIAAWAVYSMIQSSEAPLPIRIGVIGTILGAAFVLISLIGERSKEEEVDVGRKY